MKILGMPETAEDGAAGSAEASAAFAKDVCTGAMEFFFKTASITSSLAPQVFKAARPVAEVS